MTPWGGGFDSDLSSKVDALLNGRTTAKQKVEDFLTEELHVDPSKLPISFKDAKALINEKMQQRDSASCHFEGSTMGLSAVVFTKGTADEPSTCPNCNQSGYYYRTGTGNKWLCDECDQEFAWTPGNGTKETVTERTDNHLWPDLMRIYMAFVKAVHPKDEDDGDAPDCQECGASNAGSRRAPHLCEVCEKRLKPSRPPIQDYTKFTCTASYNTAEVVGVADKPIRIKRPSKYPVGTTLRVTDGTKFEWVRVGGPFSDDQIVILATMKPIPNPTKWTVVEVLRNDQAPSP